MLLKRGRVRCIKLYHALSTPRTERRWRAEGEAKKNQGISSNFLIPKPPPSWNPVAAAATSPSAPPHPTSFPFLINGSRKSQLPKFLILDITIYSTLGFCILLRCFTRLANFFFFFELFFFSVHFRFFFFLIFFRISPAFSARWLCFFFPTYFILTRDKNPDWFVDFFPYFFFLCKLHPQQLCSFDKCALYSGDNFLIRRNYFISFNLSLPTFLRLSTPHFLSALIKIFTSFFFAFHRYRTSLICLRRWLLF